MIDWVVILAGLCVGLGLFAAQAARRETFAHPTTRLFVWAVPAVASLLAVAAAGVNVWSEARNREADTARALALPGANLLLPPGLDSLAPVIEAAGLAPAAPPAEQAALAAEPADASWPRLRIPSLNLDEPIRAIPLRNGQWDISALGAGLGWLESTGARPMDTLAMVFIGHMTVSVRERGAFAELQHVRLGAEVIYTLDGQSYVYEVREKGRMETDDVKRVYLPAGDTLLLLTCADWDPDARDFARRLLVRAVRVTAPASGAPEAGAP